MRNELSAFTRRQVWLTLLLASTGFGGIFAVYTYIAPVVTDVATLPLGLVPWVLVVFGIGMTVGTFISGWLTDRSVTRALIVCLSGLGISVLGFALFAHTEPGLLIFIFLIGSFAGGCSPAIQTRLMDVSHNAQSIAAALNHSSLNIGNSLGAFLGGLAIAAGFGYISPAYVGVGLAIVGLVVLMISLGIDRKRTRSRVTVGG
jgi:DHA1 family inner membrane transport protein